MSFAIHQEQLEQVFTNFRKKVNTNSGETVSEEFRGYSWHDVVVPVDLQLDLPFSLVAYNYCDSGRFLYLRKVLNQKDEMNFQRIRGRLVDECVLDMITDTIRYLAKKKKPHSLRIHSFLQSRIRNKLKQFKDELKKYDFLKEEEKKMMLTLCKNIMQFEYGMIVSRIQYLVSKTRDITMESMVGHALPIFIDHRITARDMGFSEKMTPDFVFNNYVVGDLKGVRFDKSNLSYRIAVTGYALAYEKTNHVQVDVGCVLYLDIDKTKETPVYDLDVFIIKDEYRKAFITKRDFLLKMVRDRRDPGLASKCPQSCPYLKTCNPSNDRIDKSK